MAGYPPQQPGGYQQQPQGQYPQQQQPYGQQYGANVMPHRGTMLIVFAILGWVVCLIFGIVALIMSKGDLEKMRQGQMDRSGEGVTKAAYYISLVELILAAVFFVLWIILFAVGAASGGIR